VGDRVVIVETRPLSARKRFMLKEILETAKISESDRVEKVTADETEEEGEK
jgi:hypothetical protein